MSIVKYLKYDHTQIKLNISLKLYFIKIGKSFPF